MKFALIITLLILGIQGYSQNNTLNCDEFKRGKFVVNPAEGDFISIKRTKKYQIEQYNKRGKKHKFSIEWTSDCEYILKLVKTEARGQDAYIGKGLFCKIISGTDNYYTCIVITPEHPKGRKCEVTKLR